MDIFEELTVHEYFGNDATSSRKAKYCEATRTIEYEPEPDYPDFEEETQEEEDDLNDDE
ncbi:hypothetical protein [Bacillus sp. AFS073361]|uniref:hypothetical protein n=1 Tax=Bacillus sp. AFS073361 TaxID=2033511 RepID=UPI0015D47B82|nr:hypothetical protein [Bacillus sp. AFS073361]